MILLSGADLVLSERVLSPGTLVMNDGRIVEIRAGGARRTAGGEVVDLAGHLVLPGFVDLHAHGLDGHDTLGGTGAVTAIARRMPTYGVVAFAPTTVACPPGALRTFLEEVRTCRLRREPAAAHVLPAHLESNFISAEYRGAQPVDCLRRPPTTRTAPGREHPSLTVPFTADDVLAEIARAEPDVGTVTVAPELDGALDLIRRLTARGHRVALGHSGASFEAATAAIDAGASMATHLFNRMPPLDHREPGLAGAALSSDAVTVEVICDGVHVHPSMVRLAVAAKAVEQALAITDSTARAGSCAHAEARLAGRSLTVSNGAAYLEDGTLAGSVLTMDGAFRTLTGRVGLPLTDAARLCATNPARVRGLAGRGVLAVGATADVVVLDRAFRVARTYVDGALVYDRHISDVSG